MSERIAQVEANDDAEEKEKTIVGNKGKVDNPIAMTATTEFCNVVQTPLEKMETLKHESFRGSTLYKQQATSRRVKAGALGSKRQAMAFDAEDTRGFSKPEEEEETPLTEEALDMSAASGANCESVVTPAMSSLSGNRALDHTGHPLQVCLRRVFCGACPAVLDALDENVPARQSQRSPCQH